MRAKVSVIVPIYNISLYIEQCVRSLLEQTLEEMEFIFVNDCTPDNSMEILLRVLDDYPQRKNQCVIDSMSSNSGLSAVRTRGIEKATGEYIIHCDGDDWVDRDLYESLYLCALNRKADIVVCPVKDEYQGKTQIHSSELLPKNPKTILKEYHKYCMSMYTVNKLVKSSIYKENGVLPFEGINMWEDNGLMHRVFYYANTLSQIDGSYYHYRRDNVSAITRTYGEEHVRQMIKCASLLTVFYQSKPDAKDYEKTVTTLQYLAKINLIRTSISDIKKYRETFPNVKRPPKDFNLDAFSYKGKIRYFFVKYHFAWLFVIIFKAFLFVRSKLDGVYYGRESSTQIHL